jgi:hypothetical protein
MFVYGYIIAHTANYQFNVSESTIKKYVNIRIDVFNDRDKLFYKYIYIFLLREICKKIINYF